MSIAFGVSFSQGSGALVYLSRTPSVGSSGRLQKQLRPVKATATFIRLREQVTVGKKNSPVHISLSYQFRFLRVHPYDHVLMKSRQQVTDAIILNFEFLLTLVVLQIFKDCQLSTKLKFWKTIIQREESVKTASMIMRAVTL